MKHILMLGDSLVEWGNWEELLPEITVLNRGRAGEFLPELSLRLAEEVAASRGHDVILLQSGTNDILSGNAGFPSIYTTMLPRLRLMEEECPIILCSLAPMPLIPLPRIRAVNKELHQLSAEVENCFFLDLVEPFISQCLPITHPGFLNDQVHFSTRGYQVWAGEIRKQLASIFPAADKN
ncbi:MAG: hypothetical protein HQQ73_01195 [Desulfobulbaceae bacterium]|nr:hypothetical protein [Desulfobulbaceae bacterium]